MAQNAQQLSPALAMLDAIGRILWAERIIAPYKLADVIGRHLWDFLAPPEDSACQSAILRCTATGKPQTIDVNFARIGMWRVELIPAKVGKVRVVIKAQPFPRDVLLLSRREIEVCAALAGGATGKQVAARLGIKRSTLDNHRRNISQKLGIPTPSLVAWSAANRAWF